MKTIYVLDKIGNKYHYNQKEILDSVYDEPAVILQSGEQRWYQDGLLHRENDNPAVIIPGHELQYYYMGKKHRENGPAVINVEYQEYWINGHLISEENFKLNRKLNNKLAVKNSIQKRKI